MKYKIGDKVRVREDLVAEKQYGKDFFVSQMIPFKGQIVTIKTVKEGRYTIEEDCGDWYWTERMFLPINKYNVGDKVLVRKDLIEYEKYGGQSFVPSMNNFQGKIVTIYDVADNGYRIKEDFQNWRWTDEMFSGKISEDFSSEEFNSQSILSKEENSSDIITVKTNKVKLLLL